MSETPFFGNAVNLINAYVEAGTDVHTGTKVPATRPARFIRTVRTGGFRRDPITDVARITFEWWDETGTAAERGIQQVRDIMHRSPGKTLSNSEARFKIHRVEEVAGPADSPDPDTSSPRYTMTLEIHLRGRMLRSIP